MTRQILSLIAIVLGLVLLTIALFPLVAGQLHYAWSQPPQLIDPTALEPGVTDYTQAANWFTLPAAPATTPPPVTDYVLTIPKLNLVNVPVQIYGTDLKLGPLQYTGTALPGHFGNPVIFGHSTLPSLFHPADPLSIFNFLPTLQIGDGIWVKYDKVTYKYIVKDTREVKPTQIEVLNQDYSRRQLTIITCVPLGTYLRRFVVLAELAN